MAGEKLIHLIRSLKQATAEHRVQWKHPMNFSTPAFEIDLGEAGLVLEREASEGSERSYSVAIKNRSGQTVEIEFFEESGENEDHFPLVNELYMLARNDSLKVDELLETMIRAVDKSA